MKIYKYLKVAFFVYLFSLLMVSCGSAGREMHLNMDMINVHRYRHRANLDDIDWSKVKVSYVRNMEIYNACSQQRLQITHRRSVNAYGQQNSSSAQLRLETLKVGSEVLGFRILSNLYNTYLCFNKRGKLNAKFKGSSLKCVFREKMSWDDHTQYQSLFHRTWFVGFNRKGKPLAGEEKVNTRRPRCFKFINLMQSPVDQLHPDSGPYNPFSDEAFEKLMQARFRDLSPPSLAPPSRSRTSTRRLKAKNAKRQSKKFRHKKRTHRRRKVRRLPVR